MSGAAPPGPSRSAPAPLPESPESPGRAGWGRCCGRGRDPLGTGMALALNGTGMALNGTGTDTVTVAGPVLAPHRGRDCREPAVNSH